VGVLAINCSFPTSFKMDAYKGRKFAEFKLHILCIAAMIIRFSHLYARTRPICTCIRAFLTCLCTYQPPFIDVITVHSNHYITCMAANIYSGLESELFITIEYHPCIYVLALIPVDYM
jgi:hypothetical protein